MEDNAILQAMAQMLEPIRQDINGIKADITGIKTKLNETEAKIEEMAEELHIVHGAQNVIADWVENLQIDVKSLNDLHSA